MTDHIYYIFLIIIIIMNQSTVGGPIEAHTLSRTADASIL